MMDGITKPRGKRKKKKIIKSGKKKIRKKVSNSKTTTRQKLSNAVGQLDASLLHRSQVVEIRGTPAHTLTRTLLQGSSVLSELCMSATAQQEQFTQQAQFVQQEPSAPTSSRTVLSLPASSPETTFANSLRQQQPKQPKQQSRSVKNSKSRKQQCNDESAATIANAAKARIAARFAAVAPRVTKAKTKTNTKKTKSQKNDPRRFHYLGGSLNLRAERERRKELEARLVATQSAVQRSTEEMQPAVGVLLKSVEGLEYAAENQQKLDSETGIALEVLRTAVSLIKSEYDTKLKDMETSCNERLATMEHRFQEDRARDRMAFTKLARSHQAEMALLRSKFVAFHESTRKRLDSLPSAISKIRSEAHNLVEPLGKKLAVMSQAVGQLDQAVFDVDREQLRMKLAMRSDDPGVGSPTRGNGNGFMNDSLDGISNAINNNNNGSGGVRESVVRRLQKELRELVNEVARDRSTMRQRTDEQATRLSDLDGRMDSQSSVQQRANSELHELVARITSVLRGDLGDQLKVVRQDLVEKIEKQGDCNEMKMSAIRQEQRSQDGMSQQNEIASHMQATASRAAVDANEALRFAREAMAKIGSVDAGLAARIVQARESASSSLKDLTLRVDILSSEFAVQRNVELGGGLELH
jgi:hypothetical protein